MIIIGHSLITFEPFYKIRKISDIAKLPPNSTVIFEFENSENIIKYCRQNDIKFAVETNGAKEALLANAAGASYIISSVKILTELIQELAENYLFDAKILLKIDDENGIIEAAKSGIDGVLLPQGVINGSF